MQTRTLSLRLSIPMYNELEAEARRRHCVISKVVKERLETINPSQEELYKQLNDRLIVLEEALNKGV